MSSLIICLKNVLPRVLEVTLQTKNPPRRRNSFLSYTDRFYRFKFRVLPSQIAVTSLPMMTGPPIHPTSVTGISDLGTMLESYQKLQ